MKDCATVFVGWPLIQEGSYTSLQDPFCSLERVTRLRALLTTKFSSAKQPYYDITQKTSSRGYSEHGFCATASYFCVLLNSCAVVAHSVLSCGSYALLCNNDRLKLVSSADQYPRQLTGHSVSYVFHSWGRQVCPNLPLFLQESRYNSIIWFPCARMAQPQRLPRKEIHNRWVPPSPC